MRVLPASTGDLTEPPLPPGVRRGAPALLAMGNAVLVDYLRERCGQAVVEVAAAEVGRRDAIGSLAQARDAEPGHATGVQGHDAKLGAASPEGHLAAGYA